VTGVLGVADNVLEGEEEKKSGEISVSGVGNCHLSGKVLKIEVFEYGFTLLPVTKLYRPWIDLQTMEDMAL
jgi:hypothetical protein